MLVKESRNSPANNSNKFIAFCFFCGTIWDAFTTFSGIYSFVDGKVFSAVLTIFINGLLTMTFIPLKKDEFIQTFGRILWVAALVGDLVTAYNGNWEWAKIKNPTSMHYFLIIISAILTTGCSIALSYFIWVLDVLELKKNE